MSDPRFDEDLSLAQIAIRVGAAFALSAAICVGILFIVGTG
jgi:hypothetical protein